MFLHSVVAAEAENDEARRFGRSIQRDSWTNPLLVPRHTTIATSQYDSNCSYADKAVLNPISLLSTPF